MLHYAIHKRNGTRQSLPEEVYWKALCYIVGDHIYTVLGNFAQMLYQHIEDVHVIYGSVQIIFEKFEIS
jgi:hypothetical protein